ncbi:MAG: hypothetical protein A2289_21580 [Deltaproteobacteria bacterium RIFOXYA12_FULL_58_15]|nr:MAG: hypothetical protein A2289_21580 [Deltaproteobacteria bacterium RIFOXYA12_FULL_58_15]OGR15004.1 MAG: hypothetical protein A2341_17840 [Deltaproteobacteria bacterium RIFOXYB12_FULL_58_9]
MAKRKAAQADFIVSVGKLLAALRREGFTPILVGGMAMVVLGSRRVTRDFDFLLEESARDQKSVTQLFYNHGFELASKVDEYGEIVQTIDSANIASVRLRTDRPKSAYFHNHRTGLRVDLLFDFPFPAKGIGAKATRTKVSSYWFHIASPSDLLQMKVMAAQDRKHAADLQDLEFLKHLMEDGKRAPS